MEKTDRCFYQIPGLAKITNYPIVSQYIAPVSPNLLWINNDEY